MVLDKEENDNLFFNMLLYLPARVVCLQLQEAVEFLQEDNRSVCFHDWKNLAVLVRLAPDGYVKVIAGHDQSSGTCPRRDVTWAFFEIRFGKTRPRSELKDRQYELEDYGPEEDRVPLERCRSKRLRTCNFDVDTHRTIQGHALTGEQVAVMLTVVHIEFLVRPVNLCATLTTAPCAQTQSR